MAKNQHNHNVIDAAHQFALRQDQHRADMTLTAYKKNMDAVEHPHYLDDVMRDVLLSMSEWEHSAVMADTNMAIGNEESTEEPVGHSRYRFIFTLIAQAVENRLPDETDTFLYANERHLTGQEAEKYHEEVTGEVYPRKARYDEFQAWLKNPDNPNSRLGVGYLMGLLMHFLPARQAAFYDFEYEEDRGVLVMQFVANDPYAKGKLSLVTVHYHARYLADMEALVDEHFVKPKSIEPKGDA